MAAALTASEAYYAGRKDFDAVWKATQKAVDTGLISGSSFETTFAQKLSARWQSRIKRGQLPPLAEKLRKVS